MMMAPKKPKRRAPTAMLREQDVKSDQVQELLELLEQKLFDLFEEANGRPAKTVEELEQWIASSEGKAALAYDQTPEGKIIPDLD
jgi:hypothetical protein